MYNRSTDERFVLVIVDDSYSVTKTISTANNSPVITITSGGTSNLFVGAVVSGTNIPTGSVIKEIGSNKITIDQDCTATGSSITMTAQASRTYVTGLSNVEPISGVLPTVVPVEQVFAGITTTNLEYFRGSGRARDRYRATSFQDLVFVTNIQKKTAYDSTETLTRYNIGLISNAYVPIKAQLWVKLVDYETKYDVSIELDNGTTITGTHTTGALASGAVSTETIAAALKTSLLAHANASNITVNRKDSQ